MTVESLKRAKAIQTQIFYTERNIKAMQSYVSRGEGLFIGSGVLGTGVLSPEMNFSNEELEKLIKTEEDFLKELQQEFENL